MKRSFTQRGPELTLRASLYFFSRLPFVLMVYNFVDFTNIVAMDILICYPKNDESEVGDIS